MAEKTRLAEADALQKHWRRWGPYLSEREWATVREDYSNDGDAWNSFPFEHSHRRAYRWGEEGIAGISDNRQLVCFALALWNGKDRVLKERMFGLTGHQGNHGEDVKECYFYLDNTPTHSYQKYLYKYPQMAFPYEKLVAENQKRTRNSGEYELKDTGAFDDNKYFDVFVEYAKSATNVNDIHIKITVKNQSLEPHPIHVLPHLWFRNRWSWNDVEVPHSADDEGAMDTPLNAKRSYARPRLASIAPTGNAARTVQIHHEKLPGFLHCEALNDQKPELLFTDNETNFERLWGVQNKSRFCKDGINARVVEGLLDATNPDLEGTKCATWYKGIVPGGGEFVIRLRLTDNETSEETGGHFGDAFEETFIKRKIEADEFYDSIADANSICPDLINVERQAFAGMLWSKQFYHYVVKEWLDGDKGQVPPPIGHKKGRNKTWRHLHVDDILSMPDKWEYPFFAAWDTAFHAVVFSMIDPWFAKKQLTLLTREWYMHPNGQLPAYEWNFSDVNPPVHAWAAHRIFKSEKKYFGKEDRLFLERVFQKLLLNFTWWVNRKDSEGNNIFEGGFLGLDNIAVFNRSEALPVGGTLRQADGTSWMAMFSLNMLDIALELAPTNSSYEDIASKFFEHFLYISDALSWKSEITDMDSSLWDEEDGFFYDNVLFNDGRVTPLKVRSLVGLIPLFAVLVLEPSVLKQCPGFKRRMDWFLENFDFTKRNVAKIDEKGVGERILLSLIPRDRLVRVLGHMLDENEFLSPYGVRSLSKYHQAHPYTYDLGWQTLRVDYLPAESDSGLFGGNSNWRGPIWVSTNFLIVESIWRYHYYYGDSLKVECPTGSNNIMDLHQVADHLMVRLVRIFLRDTKTGRRPVNGGDDKLDHDPAWRDLVLFYEYFNAETGMGIGASHQTGWTAIVAKFIQKIGSHHVHM